MRVTRSLRDIDAQSTPNANRSNVINAPFFATRFARRRFFRTLTYTSNSSLCLHDVPGDPYPDRVNNMICLSSGSPWTVRAPSPSLVISRRLNAELGIQTFIPSRYLAGTIPACLLEQYRYWQSEDDDMVGEPVDLKNVYDLTIKLNKDGRLDKEGFCCNSDAYALVQRTPNEGAGKKLKTQTLLNVMTARDGSGLKELGLLFSRLDNLSHILFCTAWKCFLGYTCVLCRKACPLHPCLRHLSLLLLLGVAQLAPHYTSLCNHIRASMLSIRVESNHKKLQVLCADCCFQGSQGASHGARGGARGLMLRVLQ